MGINLDEIRVVELGYEEASVTVTH